jgi:hypothetical protein
MIKKDSIWIVVKRLYNHFGQVDFNMFNVIGVVILIIKILTPKKSFIFRLYPKIILNCGR